MSSATKLVNNNIITIVKKGSSWNHTAVKTVDDPYQIVEEHTYNCQISNRVILALSVEILKMQDSLHIS